MNSTNLTSRCSKTAVFASGYYFRTFWNFFYFWRPSATCREAGTTLSSSTFLGCRCSTAWPTLALPAPPAPWTSATVAQPQNWF